MSDGGPSPPPSHASRAFCCCASPPLLQHQGVTCPLPSQPLTHSHMVRIVFYRLLLGNARLLLTAQRTITPSSLPASSSTSVSLPPSPLVPRLLSDHLTSLSSGVAYIAHGHEGKGGRYRVYISSQLLLLLSTATAVGEREESWHLLQSSVHLRLSLSPLCLCCCSIVVVLLVRLARVHGLLLLVLLAVVLLVVVPAPRAAVVTGTVG